MANVSATTTQRPALPAAYAALGDAESVATDAAVVPVMAARKDVHRAILATNRAVALLSLAVHRPEEARVHARAALQALGRVVELPRSTFPDDDGQVLVVTPEPAELDHADADADPGRISAGELMVTLQREGFTTAQVCAGIERAGAAGTLDRGDDLAAVRAQLAAS